MQKILKKRLKMYKENGVKRKRPFYGKTYSTKDLFCGIGAEPQIIQKLENPDKKSGFSVILAYVYLIWLI